jgi:hypothetical protein
MSLALGKLLDRLAPTVAALAAAEGTDSFYVLRSAAPVSDGRGGTIKRYTATTQTPFSALAVSTMERRGLELEQIAAKRRVPVIFRRVLCAASVDCTTLDKLTILARGEQPAVTEVEVVRSVILNGVVREIVTVEEQNSAAR